MNIDIEKESTNPAINPELLKRSNNAMLIIIAINFLGIFLSLLSDALTVIVGIATVGIIFDDYKAWENTGVQMCSRWWSLLFPVYLWKRANILGISKQIFWLWLVAVAVAIFICIIMFIFIEFKM